MIKIVSGKGIATTKLGAFDNALYNCGVHNKNLIRLSSVIPSGQEVQVVKRYEDDGRWGNRLYVVMANEENEFEAQASIGWLFDEDTGNGLFVEHSGKKSSTNSKKSLHDLAKTRDIKNYVINNLQSRIYNDDKGLWVCAMVVAVFEEQEWETL